MKRLLAVSMILMAFSTKAEWAYITEVTSKNLKSSLYVDAKTAKRNGVLVRMWTMMDYEKIKISGNYKYKSEKRLQEYDCKEDLSRSKSIHFYKDNMGGGGMIFSYTEPTEWKPIIPDTPDYMMATALCKS